MPSAISQNRPWTLAHIAASAAGFAEYLGVRPTYLDGTVVAYPDGYDWTGRPAWHRGREVLGAEPDVFQAEILNAVARGERGLEGDELFHGAVTSAARSPLLADLMTAISQAIRETRIESLSQPDRPQQSLDSHRKIAEAIRGGDAAAAASAMAEHIKLVSDVALLRDS